MRADVFKGRLQREFDWCICTSCKRRGCKLGLDRLRSDSLVIIDADKYKEYCHFEGKLCDYVLFYFEGGATVAVVELKSGRPRASEAQKQIENGSKVAEWITGSHRVSNFLPILLYGRGMKRLDIEYLKRARVPFRGEDYRLVIEKCGSQLRDCLAN